MQIHLFTALKKILNELISNPLKPLNNKSISGLYPPGSTIKTIVALSALENDIISPNMNVECKGVIELYGENSIVGKKRSWNDELKIRDKTIMRRLFL